MKKVGILLIVLLILSVGLAGCGGSQQAQQSSDSNQTQGQTAQTEENKPEMVLKLADNQAEGYPTVVGDRDFAKRVEEKTNGRIKIEVYPGGQLGDEKSVVEAVQMGAIDFARVNVSPLAEFDKTMGIFNMPYLFKDSDHMWKVLNGDIGQEILDSLQASNMVGLTYYDSGARSFYNSKIAVKKPEDLKGLKIRVQQTNMMVDLVSAFGASATPMAYNDVYSALQTGVVDGAENNWPSYYSTSHYEVAKYFTEDEHTRSPEVIIASKSLWDKLSPDDQKLIKEAAVESTSIQIDSWKKFEDEAKQKAKEAGNTIITSDQIDKEAFRKAVQPLYDKYGGDYKDLIDKITAVQ